MNCPACSHPLTHMTSGPLAVEACFGGCAGLWFDQYELVKVDEAHETDGVALAAIPRDPAWVAPQDAPPRQCPACGDVTMLQRFTSVKRIVEVDECGQCGGVFLDGGELAKIRAEFKDDAARQEAAKGFLQAVDLQLGAMKEESQQEQERVRRVASMLKILAPSWYLPGKQSWGAY